MLLTWCLFFQVNFFNIYPSVAYNPDKVLQSINKLTLVSPYHFIALYASHKISFRREISKRPILFLWSWACTVIKNKALFSVSIQECFTIGCVPMGPLNNAFKPETSWSGGKKKKNRKPLSYLHNSIMMEVSLITSCVSSSPFIISKFERLSGSLTQLQVNGRID